MPNRKFIYKNLDVWKKAMIFADKALAVSEVVATSQPHFRLIDQLEAASRSISLHIAEGTGRDSSKEFMRSLYIARASVYETMTILEIFQHRSWLTTDQLTDLEEHAMEIIAMLMGLIKRLNRDLEKS